MQRLRPPRLQGLLGTPVLRGCAANALHATGDIHGTYEYGCKVFRKRMECALMMQVAQRLDPELAKNAVKFESDCDGCGEGNDGACEK